MTYLSLHKIFEHLCDLMKYVKYTNMAGQIMNSIYVMILEHDYYLLFPLRAVQNCIICICWNNPTSIALHGQYNLYDKFSIFFKIFKKNNCKVWYYWLNSWIYLWSLAEDVLHMNDWTFKDGYEWDSNSKEYRIVVALCWLLESRMSPKFNLDSNSKVYRIVVALCWLLEFKMLPKFNLV